jgi:lipopolysaccharide transport system ATP-binding protein
MDRIYRFRQQGGTILFVSHSLDAVRNLCTSAVWLDHGELKAAGRTVDTIDAYLKWTNAKEQERLERAKRDQAETTPEDDASEDANRGLNESRKRWGTREIEITRVELLDVHGREPAVFNTGDEMTVRLHYVAHQPSDEPVFGLAIHHGNGFHINGPNSRFGGLPLGTLVGRGCVDYTIEALPLLAGNYVLTAAVFDTTITHAFDYHDQMYPFVVQTTSIAERWGSVYIPARWSQPSAGTRA